MLKYWLFLILLLPVCLTVQATEDPQKAFAEASSSGKPLLLVFQGSDWCIPCIKLDHKVLSTPEFLQFAQDNLVILKADFPQKKKLDPALEKQYEQLAEVYNKEGSFPKMVLLDENRKLVRTFRTDYTTPQELIEDLGATLKELHARP